MIYHDELAKGSQEGGLHEGSAHEVGKHDSTESASKKARGGPKANFNNVHAPKMGHETEGETASETASGVRGRCLLGGRFLWGEM